MKLGTISKLNTLGVGCTVLALACAPGEADESHAVAFGDEVQISARTEVGAAPMFSVAPNGSEAVAWVSAPDGGTDGRLYVSVDGADPVELTDPLGPIEAHGEAPPKVAFGPDGALNALYVVGKVIEGARFPLAALRFTRSLDGGKTWSEPVSVTDDSDFGSHNFHALHAGADGALYVTWLDGREGVSSVFLTRSSDGGATWSSDKRITQTEACPCCRTAIATAADGTLFVAWRIVNPGNVRDIVVAKSTDHGQTFGAPVVVHDDGWVYPGCPHAGPSMQVDAEGRLHVAWWTGKEGIAGVHYARSDDGAQTFGAPVELGVAQYSKPAHVQLALGGAGTVLVAWDDGTVVTPKVVLRTSRDGGDTFGAAQQVSAEGRAATFPVLGLSGSRVTVAWSEVSAESHQAEAQADSIQSATDPMAPHGLHAVGESRVHARRGELP
jgi:hypothetical protein